MKSAFSGRLTTKEATRIGDCSSALLEADDAVRLKRITDIAAERFGLDDWVLLEVALREGALIDQGALMRAFMRGEASYGRCVAATVAELASVDPGCIAYLEGYISQAYGIEMPDESTSVDEAFAEIGMYSPCRVFISHKTDEAVFAAALKGALAPYGIDAFVAHEDIEVSSEWARMLKRELWLCDALVYASSEGSGASSWCQQEIGWAFGRDIPVVGVSRGVVPEAFLGRRQAATLGDGHDSTGNTAADGGASDVEVDGAAQAARIVFEELLGDERVSAFVMYGLVGELSNVEDTERATWLLDQIDRAEAITDGARQGLNSIVKSNSVFRGFGHGGLARRLRQMVDEKSVLDPPMSRWHDSASKHFIELHNG